MTTIGNSKPPQLPDRIISFPHPERLSLSIRASVLIFDDPKSLALQELLRKVSPSDATVLIHGETGTGKELVARHIHELSPRKSGPFAAINCGAFSDTLVESELFGYERGAFTGAVGDKAGWFETAHGGTLFLDEVGDLPLSTQVKLLRVLQEREVIRIGSRKPVSIDVRLIAATNVNLTEAVKAGRFREDLYYRLRVVPVVLPALRERPGDILPLVEYFVVKYAQRLKVEAPGLSVEAVHALLGYPWPGNIRELENVIHRAVLICDGDVLSVDNLHLPVQDRLEKSAHGGSGVEKTEIPVCTLHRALSGLFKEASGQVFELVGQKLIAQAYEYCRGNQVQTAQLLGVSRNVLRTQLKHYRLIA